MGILHGLTYKKLLCEFVGHYGGRGEDGAGTLLQGGSSHELPVFACVPMRFWISLSDDPEILELGFPRQTPLPTTTSWSW